MPYIRMINYNFVFSFCNGSTRTSLYTISAAYAEMFMIYRLRLKNIGLRIMAPSAAKRTAFQKNGCPYTRPVMNRKSLNIENRSHHQITSTFSKILVAGAIDYFLLYIRTQRNKIGTVPGNTNNQISVILRVLFCIDQRCLIHYIKLNLFSTAQHIGSN